jgi:single-stranded DNA-binding protein
LAIQGHIIPRHEEDIKRNSEPMWIRCEVWDEEARAHQRELKRGRPVNALGTLISNKWVDESGEEKKQFAVRILKIFPLEQFKSLVGPLSGLE